MQEGYQTGGDIVSPKNQPFVVLDFWDFDTALSQPPPALVYAFEKRL
jgi:hypothetical protein